MSSNSCSTETCCRCWGNIARGIGAVGSFLIIGFLAWWMVRNRDLSLPDAERAAARLKALSDIRSANSEVMEVYKMEDPNKGLVRLPVSRAMQIIGDEWQDGQVGRQKFLKRFQNSTNVVSFE